MEVDPKKGAAIKELVLDGIPLIQPQSNYHYESSLLFPFPNRLARGRYDLGGSSYAFPQNDFGRPNALHGIIHDMNFTEGLVEEDVIRLQLSYQAELAAFPFPFDFQITYRLANNGLSIRVDVQNTGDSSFPFGFGWHPYFQLKAYEHTSLQLPNVNLVEVDEDLIPSGDRRPFTTFEEKKSIVGYQMDNCLALATPEARTSTFLTLSPESTLEIWQDEHFGFIQVFTPDDQRTLAIEPMTCNIDALNNGDGLSILQPGEAWSAQFGVSIKK